MPRLVPRYDWLLMIPGSSHLSEGAVQPHENSRQSRSTSSDYLFFRYQAWNVLACPFTHDLNLHGLILIRAAMSRPTPQIDETDGEKLATNTASTEEPSLENNPSEKMSVPSNAQNESSPAAALPPKKPSVFQRAWKALAFNPTTIMIMVKPAIAATIAMAIFQSHSVAKHYLNFGYLIIIVSITTVPILPRGKFIMNLLISVVCQISITIQKPLFSPASLHFMSPLSLNSKLILTSS